MKLLLSLGLLFFAAPSFAAIINVNNAASFQLALNSASSGDTIRFLNNIAANVTASGAPNVVIDGAGFTLTPGTPGFSILTVTTSGLTIENLTISGNIGIAVSLGAGSTGTTVSGVSFANNNVGIYISSPNGATNLGVSNSSFVSNAVGISIAFSGTSTQTQIQNSLFDKNGYGIFVNVPSELNSVRISNSVFSHNSEGLHIFGNSISNWNLLSNIFSSNSVYDAFFLPHHLDGLSVIGDIFEGSAGRIDGLFLLATLNSTFSNIEVLGSAFSDNINDGMQVVNEGSISNLSIHCNDFRSNTQDGLELAGRPITNLVIIGNIFSQNKNAGLVNSTTGLVNATQNYWGSPTGPTNPANPSGTGDSLKGDVDFIPFLTEPQCPTPTPTPTPPCPTPSPVPVL